MAGSTPNKNPKKRNRHSDQGALLPGIRAVREVRTRLLIAQRLGAPPEELEALRLELKKKKAAGKQGA